ncbi:hypothetical protein ACFLV0_07595, partial [Chloroflexota bacterium]
GYTASVECSTGDSGTDSVTFTVGPGDEVVTVHFTNTYPPPPPMPPMGAVGGEAYPISKFGLMAPWIIALTVVIIAGGFYLVRRRANSS